MRYGFVFHLTFKYDGLQLFVLKNIFSFLISYVFRILQFRIFLSNYFYVQLYNRIKNRKYVTNIINDYLAHVTEKNNCFKDFVFKNA